uniref:Uncharacterized protein n=1 Tax=Zea mays TaxID=4577 RepID=B6UAM0_MAIZE|nr:hypothetical protein [Zea mays]
MLVDSLARAGRQHDAFCLSAEMRASSVACDSHVCVCHYGKSYIFIVNYVQRLVC